MRRITSYSVGISAMAGYLLLADWVYPPERLAWHPTIAGHAVNVHHLGFFALACLSLGVLAAMRIAIPRQALLWGGLWILAWTVSAWFSTEKGAALTALAGVLIRGVVPAALAYSLTRKEGGAGPILWMLLIMVQVCAIIGLSEWFMARGPFFERKATDTFRIFGSVGHPIPLSAILLLGLPLSLLLRSRLAKTVSFTSIFICLIGTMSRSSMVLALLATVTLLWKLPAERKSILRLYLWMAAVAVMTVSVWSVVKPGSASFWLEQTKQRYAGPMLWQQMTHSHRIGSYSTTWAMVKANPFWGGGLSTFPDRYAAFIRSYSVPDILTPDNLYLRILADTGCLGFIAFMIPLGLLLRRAVRLMQPVPGQLLALNRPVWEIRFLLLVGVTNVLLSSCFFDSIFWPSVWVPFSIALVTVATSWSSPHTPSVDSIRSLKL